MSHTRLWIASAIIASIVLVGFVLSVPHTRDVSETMHTQEEISIPALTVHDVYKKGVHTITGSIALPNACAAVGAEAGLVSAEASSTPHIILAISTIDEGGICLQLPTTTTFKTTVSTTTPKLPIVVTINGTVATTTTP